MLFCPDSGQKIIDSCCQKEKSRNQSVCKCKKEKLRQKQETQCNRCKIDFMLIVKYLFRNLIHKIINTKDCCKIDPKQQLGIMTYKSQYILIYQKSDLMGIPVGIMPLIHRRKISMMHRNRCFMHRQCIVS